MKNIITLSSCAVQHNRSGEKWHYLSCIKSARKTLFTHDEELYHIIFSCSKLACMIYSTYASDTRVVYTEFFCRAIA